MIITALFVFVMSLLATGEAYAVRVCTNTACKKALSADTLEGMHILASVSDEANRASAESQLLAVAAAQSAFAASRIGSCGCLGGCGNGPNCVVASPEGEEEVFYGIYKPATISALLEQANLNVRLPQ
jgi:(2Fe-2S) ferredoxin